MACEKCGGTGWVPSSKIVTVAGLPYEAEFSSRCSCVTIARQEIGESTVTGAGMKRLFGNLSLLKFFPADEESRQALAAYIERFAITDEQLDWLGPRAVEVFREWPGPMELRNCFNSKYRPKDGITARSEIYPDGFPSEKPEPRLALPPGVEAREDPKAKEASIREAVEQLELTRAARKQRVPDLKTPLPTPEEIESVKEQQRRNQARHNLQVVPNAESTTPEG